MRSDPFSLIALSLVLGAVSSCRAAGAPAGDAPPGAPSVSPVTAGETRSESEHRAIERARRALVERGVATEGLRVDSVEATEWPDSSLGCPQPGMSYLQVITPGHVVRFAGSGGPHEVHVAGENAVICSPGLQLGPGMPRRPRTAQPARNLEKMLEQSREDLARRLGVDPLSVSVLDTTPVQFAGAGLGCELQAADSAARGVPGFRILLSQNGRPFVYHTDLRSVTACPPLESE